MKKNHLIPIIFFLVMGAIITAVAVGANDKGDVQELFSATSDVGNVAKLKVVGTSDDGAAKAKVLIGSKELPITMFLNPWAAAYQKLPLQWIDGSKLLVDGQVIYDSDSGELTNISPKLDFVQDYELDPAKTLLALVGKSGDGIETWIVNLTTQEFQKVFTLKLEEYLGELTFQVAWDKNGNLYFDSVQKRRPVIMIYSSGKATVFKENSLFPVASPDGTVLTYRLADSFFEKSNSKPTIVGVLRLDADGQEEVINENGKVDFGGMNDRFALVNSSGYAVYTVKPGLRLKKQDQTPDARAFFDLRESKVKFKTVQFGPDSAEIRGVSTFEATIN